MNFVEWTCAVPYPKLFDFGQRSAVWHTPNMLYWWWYYSIHIVSQSNLYLHHKQITAEKPSTVILSISSQIVATKEAADVNWLTQKRGFQGTLSRAWQTRQANSLSNQRTCVPTISKSFLLSTVETPILQSESVQSNSFFFSSFFVLKHNLIQFNSYVPISLGALIVWH